MPPRTKGQLEHVRAALGERYDVEREVGAGGMATVYGATDRSSGRRVAVKVLHPELALTLGPARFRREIAILSRLDHPNILPVLESGEVERLLYFTMPWLEDETLRRRMDRQRRMPLSVVLQVLRDVAAGVDYAHERNIVHRDLKPENILFAGPRAVLCDFGVARAIIISGEQQLSSSGLVLGSALYMSPEQARGDDDLDNRTDIYALGCVVYEMLAGTPPFEGLSRQSILARHIADTPPPLRTVRPDVPAPVEAAVHAALAKDRARRPGSGAELVARVAGDAA
jgi:serine/threonine-protein kinase